ncbi:MAG TPA: hypothetical protein VGC64_08055 [Pyrinomonadaceae bacterium]
MKGKLLVSGGLRFYHGILHQRVLHPSSSLHEDTRGRLVRVAFF